MAGLTSVSGLISGMKTDEVIQQILQVEARPLRQYQAQQDGIRSRLDAYREARTRISALKEAASQLATASFFSHRTVTSSQTDVMAATAAIGAAPGEYTVTVESVARAHQVLSQSYADVDASPVGIGTLSITAGGQTTTIDVDSSNNTLAGLRDAINRADGNIRAAIVQDGDSSYRLMISSKETGTTNALTIDSSLSGGTAPAFTDLQAAADARVKLGTGDNALTVTRSTNTVTDLVPGVTLNLLSASPDDPISVTVAQDKAKIQEGVQKLVDQYNSAVEYFNQQFKFDPESGQGGVLLSDASLRSAQDDLYEALTGTVNGAGLADVGISLGADGKLSLDAAKFQEQLDADPHRVMEVFALTGVTTHGGVQFLSAGADTVVGDTPYAVTITQAARQARVTAGTAQTAPLGGDEILTINNVEISLAAGMSQSEVIAAINARAGETEVTVSATSADGTGAGSFLTFRSASYGSAASVAIVSSGSGAGGDSSGVGNVTATAESPGGESSAGTGEAGLDVVGTINGEVATGVGQVLTGTEGNASTAGLRLRISATTPGALGTILMTEGVASAAKRAVDRLMDSDGGPLQAETDSLEQRIEDLDALISTREDALIRREEVLRLKFNAMEAALAQFQQQSSYLSSQLAAL